MSLLNGRLELHGADAERLARNALEHTLRNRGIRLRPHELEDALSYLVAEAWKMSLTFEPARGNFTQYANRRLRLRVVDWHRDYYGRTKWAWADRVYERPKRDTVSLDADGGDLGQSLPGGGLDDGEHRLSDQLRSLHARARRPPGRNRRVDRWAA